MKDGLQGSLRCNALASVRPTVNASRIDYALAVVQTSRLPVTAPPGLPADQIATAREWLRKPESIFQELIPKSRLPAINVGLTSPTNAFMLDILGAPRSSYSNSCQPIANTALSRRIKSTNIGPLRVQGLDSALDSLRSMMAVVQKQQRLVYRVIQSNGMLCTRYVVGSKTRVSNHSWGTAIDLYVARKKDDRGDNQVLFGLLLIAPVFNLEG